MTTPIFDIHPDTLALKKALEAVSVGATIQWASLSQAIGREARNCKHLLYSAMRMAERDSGAVFSNERNVGYKRLKPEDAHTVGAHFRGVVRRRGKRAHKSMVAVASRTNDMSRDAQMKLSREISAAALLRELARDKAVERTAKPDDDLSPLPVAETAKRMLASI